MYNSCGTQSPLCECTYCWTYKWPADNTCQRPVPHQRFQDACTAITGLLCFATLLCLPHRQYTSAPRFFKFRVLPTICIRLNWHVTTLLFQQVVKSRSPTVQNQTCVRQGVRVDQTEACTNQLASECLNVRESMIDFTTITNIQRVPMGSLVSLSNGQDCYSGLLGKDCTHPSFTLLASPAINDLETTKPVAHCSPWSSYKTVTTSTNVQ